ncbi:hypothetical protein BDW74DRAFT_94778 [Aspergillus multicolor]|uniref:uncharacterized protein n=1 Tax=Aspergillus multicolor TaxID=41759 RepID=UPI003CCD7E75
MSRSIGIHIQYAPYGLTDSNQGYSGYIAARRPLQTFVVNIDSLVAPMPADELDLGEGEADTNDTRFTLRVMGSSLSLPSRDKRRRSNRLSKPPQNQSVSGCPSSRSLPQPAEQTLSLPSTPTAWQNPWTGASVPVGSDDVVLHNPRSQSFSAKPLSREATLRSSVARRSIHNTCDSWPLSPTSPTPTSSRQGSFYERPSFHPSEVATFQPTTLQSNPQSSPLIGQPKRSYSVHSSSQKSRTGIQQRALDRFGSFNSHTRIKHHETLPIRRRSLLIRPGVATRKAATIPFSESYNEPTVSPESLAEHASTHGDTLPRDVKLLSQYRPATPSDFGYTHLGSLQLGSLRVVNGSASPCPSDRTGLNQAGSPTLEAISADLDIGNPPGTETTLPSEAYAGNQPILDTTDPNHVSITPNETCHNVLAHSVSSARSPMPATVLDTSCATSVGDDVDFPASPFSFEKSPTLVSCCGMDLREADDEGISVYDKERVPISSSGKVPERHLSYSSCASSHIRGDSGYSSAASNRNSSDSHGSLRRSPGFRKLLGDSAQKLELLNANNLTIATIEPCTCRHFSLPDHNLNSEGIVQEQSTIIPSVYRSRRSSLPNPGSSVRPISLPWYCTQLRHLEFATIEPLFPTLMTPNSNNGQDKGDLCLSLKSDKSSYLCPTTFASKGPSFRGETLQKAVAANAPFPSHCALCNQHRCTDACHSDSNDGQESALEQQCQRHSSAVKSNNLHFVSGQSFAAEPPRGRVRSRTVGYRYYSPSGQQPKPADIYA